ncbi:MAG: GNAT family N-acetyltransferase, partial [Firmicutes bacterium]|nr:GNAT family N-acetyltransferase [Bacillota bacterium]
RIQEADNSVNNFLLDEAVKLAQKLGAELFHFGGGRTGSTDDSLLKFKKNFSKTTFDFHIGKKIYNQKVYDNVVEQWKANHPLSYQKHAIKLLGYREI